MACHLQGLEIISFGARQIAFAPVGITKDQHAADGQTVDVVSPRRVYRLASIPLRQRCISLEKSVAAQLQLATNLLMNIFAPLGIETTFVDIRDLAAIQAAVTEAKPVVPPAGE